jgi:hypothetical protein
MFYFLILILIISNIFHVMRYIDMDVGIYFSESFLTWNIVTFILLFWVGIYRPSPETLEWLLTFAR